MINTTLPGKMAAGNYILCGHSEPSVLSGPDKPMTIGKTRYYPIFDPWRDGRPLGMKSKTSLALLLWGSFTCLEYLAMDDRAGYYDQRCWIIGAVISTAVMAVYLANEVIRGSLSVMDEVMGDNRLSQAVISQFFSNRAYLIAGTCFAAGNVAVVIVLGLPPEYHYSVWSQFVLYLGYLISGFSAGLGLWAILAVIVLYLKFSTTLQHALDPEHPDGLGGIRKLDGALWYFAGLTAAVGLLVSSYLVSVGWTNLDGFPARLVFVLWLAFPYVLAISIVLIPGLALRRQIDQYKNFREKQLREERARLQASFKRFEPATDAEIIARKREIQEHLKTNQRRLEQLRSMRSSHLGIS